MIRNAITLHIEIKNAKKRAKNQNWKRWENAEGIFKESQESIQRCIKQLSI